ncbi:hypothetical protein [Rhodanobacter sp. FW106-PBR-LB-2-11]|uniref:hypothetical protein n=1 Tax=Rhodanobacter sp. FW106-PBR-LB-2-11 TaxID=1524463 RepID=UPI0034E389DF
MSDLSTPISALAEGRFRSALAALVNRANEAIAYIRKSPQGNGAAELAAGLDHAIQSVDAMATDALEAMAEPPLRTVPKFTVFIQKASGAGTTHISVHAGADADAAVELAMTEAAAAWGGWDRDNLRVLGVVKGDVEIERWDGAGE